VTWTNNDFVDHTTTFGWDWLELGRRRAGGKFSVTFQSAGTFPYHCTLHPSMVGTVVVR
jgi:plastocyanin